MIFGVITQWISTLAFGIITPKNNCTHTHTHTLYVYIHINWWVAEWYLCGGDKIHIKKLYTHVTWYHISSMGTYISIQMHGKKSKTKCNEHTREIAL